LPGSSSFESTFGQNEYDYAQWKQNALVRHRAQILTIKTIICIINYQASYATDKTYDFGDSVGVAVSLGAAGEDDYATAFGGVLPFPTTSHLGTCSDSGRVHFSKSADSEDGKSCGSC